MKFSPQQQGAISAVKAWLGDPDQQVFRLFGYAGTGKTTLAKHLAAGQSRRPAFAAFTGKAAKVLQDKGCAGASTIHSLIYDPRQNDKTGLVKWRKTRINMDQVDLVIIDECSMVGEDIGTDLLSFGKKVLVLGDPAQLPPVSGGGFFTDHEPDFMLDEIHRQAQESPILRLATQIRTGTMPSQEYESEELRITRRAGLEQEDVTRAGAVLVGKNATRHRFNMRLRDLKGFTSQFPEANDILICLRNDKGLGLLNGGLWRVHSTKHARKTDRGRLLGYELEDLDYPGLYISVDVFEHFFQGDERVKELDWRDKRGTQEFNFGYAITVHKSQGSQWDEVCLFDESSTFGHSASRWLYTGVTRAARKLTLVI